MSRLAHGPRRPETSSARDRREDRDLVGVGDGIAGLAGSPFTQTFDRASTAAKCSPYRSQAAASTDATSVPGTSSLPRPAASRAAAKRRNTATQPTIVRVLRWPTPADQHTHRRHGSRRPPRADDLEHGEAVARPRRFTVVGARHRPGAVGRDGARAVRSRRDERPESGSRTGSDHRGRPRPQPWRSSPTSRSVTSASGPGSRRRDRGRLAVHSPTAAIRTGGGRRRRRGAAIGALKRIAKANPGARCSSSHTAGSSDRSSAARPRQPHLANLGGLWVPSTAEGTAGELVEIVDHAAVAATVPQAGTSSE